MKNKETNVDCMKYRKHTHLAGVDVEAIIAEKGRCILTIREAYYARAVDVSGNKTDGYFIEWEEQQMPMVVNSGNRKTIAKLVKAEKGIESIEARNLINWKGMMIELFFDPNVKMMGQITGGIKVKDAPVMIVKKELTDEAFERAITAIVQGKFSKDKVLNDYLLRESQIKRLEEL